MGYTHRYTINDLGQDLHTKEIARDIRAITKASGLSIGDYQGTPTSQPTLGPTEIRFNGIGKEGAATFVFPPDSTSALTTFVQENSPQVQDNTVQPIAKDIQAILTVIGRRNPKYDQKNLRLDLSGTYLHGAKLMDAKLEHVDLTGANLRTALFFRVNFRGAIFQDTILQETNFKDSNLTKCYFKGATMQGAELQGSNLSNADLSEAKDVTKEQVKSAITNQKTKLPLNYSISKTYS